jgi:hypothetical protein
MQGRLTPHEAARRATMDLHALSHQLEDIARQLRAIAEETKILRDLCHSERDDEAYSRSAFYCAAKALVDASISSVISASSYARSAATVGDWRTEVSR